MSTQLNKFSGQGKEMEKTSTLFNGLDTPALKAPGSPKRIYWIHVSWSNFIPKISSKTFLSVILCLLHVAMGILPAVSMQSDPNHINEPTDFDMNGKRVTYYPDALMISHNPQAVVFYQNTQLFNVFLDLRTPPMGKDFTLNNTCSQDQSVFLDNLLLQLRTVQKATQRLLSAHGLTSLIECDSYLRRFYQYSTGLEATMTCPYAYKQSLQQCKLWALSHCSHISPHERTWLQNSHRAKRSLPWACTAGLAGIPRFFYTSFGGSCETNHISGLTKVLLGQVNSMSTVDRLLKTINGKTIYLTKISDKLVTKVTGLASSLRQVDATFQDWQAKFEQFSLNENCHFNNFMEFLSKFSLEVTRSFSTLLRFIEINDILHQSHQLHTKDIVGFADIPSFLIEEIDHHLQTIPLLTETAAALQAGFPLLLQPMVDYQYLPAKSLGINIFI